MPARSQELMAAWNALVPLAQRVGVRGVRTWTMNSSVSYATARLTWLRGQLTARGVDVDSIELVIPDTAAVALQTGFAVLETDLSSYTFGVEIECIMPPSMTRHALAALLVAGGTDARVEILNHNTRTWWKLVSDSSLRSPQGAELVSPVLSGQAGFDALRKVCEVLEAHNVGINRHCGLHVHVGARGRPVGFVRNLLRLYAHLEPALDSITARSRRGNGNHYCQSTQEKVQRLDNMIGGALTLPDLLRVYAPTEHARYEKLNLAAWWRHGTVEFRQHQGTVRFDRIAHWVKMCLRMFHAAGTEIALEGVADLQSLANLLRVPQDELAFYARRQIELARVMQERR
jgi:hypothetical protein